MKKIRTSRSQSVGEVDEFDLENLLKDAAPNLYEELNRLKWDSVAIGNHPLVVTFYIKVESGQGVRVVCQSKQATTLIQTQHKTPCLELEIYWETKIYAGVEELEEHILVEGGITAKNLAAICQKIAELLLLQEAARDIFDRLF